jgi:hypothetical protein
LANPRELRQADCKGEGGWEIVELKKCECGGKPWVSERENEEGEEYTVIYCTDCDIEVSAWTQDDAAEKWNTRQPKKEE